MILSNIVVAIIMSIVATLFIVVLIFWGFYPVDNDPKRAPIPALYYWLKKILRRK